MAAAAPNHIHHRYARTEKAGFQVLFDRCFFGYNRAELNGAIFSAYSGIRANLIQFTFDGRETQLKAVPFDPYDVFQHATVDKETGVLLMP
jgi:hypothetical protein